MPDDYRPHSPPLVLRTRPATLLTAIGLCLIILVMQVLPQVRNGGLDRILASTAAVHR
ncbi:hypothetical protein [Reyranella sp.]|uniref:hypothetical protein n=1 Tax=Reyranella sp. TaxID=1929291 RepID=UPI003BAD7D83